MSNRSLGKVNYTATIFAGDHYHFYLSKKTEKIASALYLVTNFLSDNEPLKWHLREEGTHLIKLLLSVIRQDGFSRRETIKDTQLISAGLVSLLTVAFTGGMISEMNFSILKQELEGFIHNLEENKGRLEKKEYMLTPTLFETGVIVPELGVLERPVGEHTMRQKKVSPFKGHFKGQIDIKDKIEGSGGQISSPSEVKNSLGVSLAERKNKRRSLVIELLRKRTTLHIKDFIQEIKDCSEKTVQRELFRLVGEGVLKKEGKRRWSVYSLVSPPVVQSEVA